MVVAVVSFVVVAVMMMVVVVDMFLAAMVVAVVVVVMMAVIYAVVVIAVVAVVVTAVVTASASTSTSSSVLPRFWVFGIFVFSSHSLFVISWSIGVVISRFSVIIRRFVVGRFLLFSFITSCRCISFRTIASSISCSIASSVIRCILISLHVGDQISWVRTVTPFLWRRQSSNIEKQERSEEHAQHLHHRQIDNYGRLIIIYLLYYYPLNISDYM